MDDQRWGGPALSIRQLVDLVIRQFALEQLGGRVKDIRQEVMKAIGLCCMTIDIRQRVIRQTAVRKVVKSLR